MQPKELLLTTPKPGFCWFHASFPGLLAAVITIVFKCNLSPPWRVIIPYNNMV